jgi:hypothetical protein
MAMFTYATTEELLEALFTVRSMPRLDNEEQLPSWDSLESELGSAVLEP